MRDDEFSWRHTDPPQKGISKAKSDEIKALKREGLTMSAIAKRLGIGKGSVRRVLAATGGA